MKSDENINVLEIKKRQLYIPIGTKLKSIIGLVDFGNCDD